MVRGATPSRHCLCFNCVYFIRVRPSDSFCLWWLSLTRCIASFGLHVYNFFVKFSVSSLLLSSNVILSTVYMTKTISLSWSFAFLFRGNSATFGTHCSDPKGSWAAPVSSTTSNFRRSRLFTVHPPLAEYIINNYVNVQELGEATHLRHKYAPTSFVCLVTITTIKGTVGFTFWAFLLQRICLLTRN